MLILTCPYCNIKADETELQAGGQAHLMRFGPNSTDEDFTAYMFMRKNPKGIHFELWRHIYGCGKWFHVARCTVSLEIFGCYHAQTTAPPDFIREAIRKKHPKWHWEDEK